jgi:hypothetical protein
MDKLLFGLRTFLSRTRRDGDGKAKSEAKACSDYRGIVYVLSRLPSPQYFFFVRGHG